MMFDIVKQRYLSRDSLVGPAKPSPLPMLLRLMDTAYGIVANFLLSLSFGASMVGDPPFQDRIYSMCYTFLL